MFKKNKTAKVHKSHYALKQRTLAIVEDIAAGVAGASIVTVSGELGLVADGQATMEEIKLPLIITSAVGISAGAAAITIGQIRAGRSIACYRAIEEVNVSCEDVLKNLNDIDKSCCDCDCDRVDEPAPSGGAN